MSDYYKATANEYRTNRICRACHNAGFTEAQTIEALVAENNRLVALAVDEATKPKPHTTPAHIPEDRVWVEAYCASLAGQRARQDVSDGRAQEQANIDANMAVQAFGLREAYRGR